MKRKIGILRCSNVANEVSCPSVGCFESFNKGEGHFAQYGGSGGAELVGVITCAGCPTSKAPGKVMRQVRNLAECGAETIHLSSCMMMVCPFRNKYVSLIKAAYPHLTVVEGTHVAPEPVEQAFDAFITGALIEPRKGMADLMAQLQQMMPPQAG